MGNIPFLTGMAAAVKDDETVTYLFGGDVGLTLVNNDVRVISAPNDAALQVQTLTTDPQPRPPGRTGASMVFVSSHPQRLIMLGGRSGITAGDVLYGDVWQLCLEV